MALPKPSLVSDALERATTDIVEKWPMGRIRVNWNGDKASGAPGPNMVTLVANGSRVRLFVDDNVLVERGDAYQKFLEKAVALLTESMASYAVHAANARSEWEQRNGAPREMHGAPQLLVTPVGNGEAVSEP